MSGSPTYRPLTRFLPTVSRKTTAALRTLPWPAFRMEVSGSASFGGRERRPNYGSSTSSA